MRCDSRVFLYILPCSIPPTHSFGRSALLCLMAAPTPPLPAGVPFNSLHQDGFISIGCQPCTRPVLPTQHERLGRWWWEDASKKECGLHAKAEKIA